MSRTAVGIDLGTTYSCVAVVVDGKPRIIPSDTGSNTVPSIVSFDEEECLIGDAALDQMNYNFRNTVSGIKRLIGRPFNDKWAQDDIKRFFYKVIEREGGILVEVQYREEIKHYTPEEISTMILEKLKGQAEAFLGGEVHDAVISVPAYFNNNQRQFTRDAGTKAGFNVLRIISEPTASALGFGKAKMYPRERKIFVFDFGGGTFDASVLSVKREKFSVLAVGGDTHLGGEDVDNLLVDYCIAMFEKEHAVDIPRRDRARRRLKSACEKAKRKLSSKPTAKIDIQSFYDDEDLLMKIDIPKLNSLCQSLFERTIEISRGVLEDAGLGARSIDDVLLIGGSTRIPRIRTLVHELFGRVPNVSVNPDEAVAVGAALHAANFSDLGDEMNLVVHDVIPFTIGFRVRGDIVVPLFKRNTTFPAMVNSSILTVSDNQKSINLEIYEGERAKIVDNDLLGSFRIEQLPPARRGCTEAAVTAEIDESGILRVSAVSALGRKSGITISANPSFSLSPRQIASRLEDSAKFREADRLERERVTALRNLDNLVYELRDKAESGRYCAASCAILWKLFADKVDWVDKHLYATKQVYMEVLASLKTTVAGLL